MSLTASVQGILSWSRNYIPDNKTRNKSVRNLEIGATSLATGVRESFYLKHSPVGSVFLYVEPYNFSASSTLASLQATDKKFLWDSNTLKATFPNGVSDPSIRPFQFRPVLAQYEYYENVAYIYSDNELAGFLQTAVAYLNNTYEKAYSFTGTISTLIVSYSTDNDKELISKALAVIVRKSYLSEQKRRGLGIRFSGPGSSIDSVQQMKAYQEDTNALEEQIDKQVNDSKVSSQAGGQVIDIYREQVVQT